MPFQLRVYQLQALAQKYLSNLLTSGRITRKTLFTPHTAQTPEKDKTQHYENV